jgi:mycothiol system anti-sigma-R factor
MSCGNPHETPCTEVLDAVYSYLDGEIDDHQRALIVQHLDECGPCLQQLHRSCACESAPEQLRVQIVTRIRQVSVTYHSTEQ